MGTLFRQSKHDGLPPSPVAEVQPLDHPQLLFRAHSPRGRFRLMHLGGDEYFMQGLWTVLFEGRILVVQDRLFRVQEMRFAFSNAPLPQPSPLWGPFLS